MTTDGIVRTGRLDLHPLSLDLIDAVLSGDVGRAGGLASFEMDEETFAGDDYVLGLRQAQLRADPALVPWLYRAAVERATGVVVGKVGFHNGPDADGTVEIGYRVGPAFRRRGYATEMAAGLLTWARDKGARRCLASTSPDNVASQVIIDRLGFVRTGEQMDEVDGLEWVYTLEWPEVPPGDR